MWIKLLVNGGCNMNIMETSFNYMGLCR